MDLGVRNKVALVAASSKGIGHAVAAGLAAEGARVAICARNELELKSAAEAIQARTGSDVFWRVADVTKADQVESLVRATQSTLGPIEILINNAGGPPSGTFESCSDDAFRQAIELNLMASIVLTRWVIPGMKQMGWGRIVNITSIAVKQPVDNLILSNTARAGLIGWAKSLSNELAPFHITVNNVCPGYTRTQRVEELALQIALQQRISPEEVMARWQTAVPMNRLGLPQEIASAVIFLASDPASYITGISLQVDGGYVRGLF
jgi:3-oxoacyl-[acyl-carrier protein] reductase